MSGHILGAMAQAASLLGRESLVKAMSARVTRPMSLDQPGAMLDAGGAFAPCAACCMRALEHLCKHVTQCPPSRPLPPPQPMAESDGRNASDATQHKAQLHAHNNDAAVTANPFYTRPTCPPVVLKPCPQTVCLRSTSSRGKPCLGLQHPQLHRGG